MSYDSEENWIQTKPTSYTLLLIALEVLDKLELFWNESCSPLQICKTLFRYHISGLFCVNPFSNFVDDDFRLTEKKSAKI